MNCIYTTGIYFYRFLIFIASLFNSKAKQWIVGRKDLMLNLKKSISHSDRIAWFHCASLGEFEQGRPLIEAYKQVNPTVKILLTFFSPSGFEIRRNYDQADYVFYLPIDTPPNAKSFINIIRPEIVFFIKYEFWFNYLKVLHKKSIPVYVISAVFRSEQYFFKWYGKWARKHLKNINHFFVQDKQSAKILKENGFSQVTLSGDTRFDRVASIAAHNKLFEQIRFFSKDALTLIAGSTWPADEEVIAKFINNPTNNIRLIIAPHEVNREHIAQLKNLFTVSCTCFSETNEQSQIKSKVLIIDSIGILSHVYQYGDIAYIGGGFGKGIHNILEAATFGLPILFGPNFQKFNEAKELIELGAAFTINNFQAFSDTMNEFISKKDKLESDLI